MPRPTPAQLAYGSVTVVCSTLALLLVTGATSGPAVTLIAVLSLALGLLVAVRAPLTRAVRPRRAGHSVTGAAPAAQTARTTPASPTIAATSVTAGSESGATADRLVPVAHGR
ncbi:hypothetical protein [Streptomyces oceani]|uniref:Uncharacterized protein n=1 Tax=Streptomyces oceani TaxID=1075402 RepID=A0A1E7KG72_9ACTN|nr:hypothetical protein [Streptomyces oceani]OEV02863.1 hypothetical protein AN216_15795 [Streptomyces oceani]